MKRGVEGDLVKVIEKTEKDFKTFFDSSNKIEIKTNLQYLQPKSSTKFDKNWGGYWGFSCKYYTKNRNQIDTIFNYEFFKKTWCMVVKILKMVMER